MTYDIDALPSQLRSRITVAPDGHWLWTGNVNNKGYGVIYAAWPTEPERPKQNRPAHVVVYEHLVGPVADGHELDHTCVHTICVWPECLDEVTHAENQRRSGLRQTHCRKAGHPRTGANTYRNPRTGRTSCRACARDRDRERGPKRRRGKVP